MRTEVGYSQRLDLRGFSCRTWTHARKADILMMAWIQPLGALTLSISSSAGVRGEGKWLGSLPGWYRVGCILLVSFYVECFSSVISYLKAAPEAGLWVWRIIAPVEIRQVTASPFLSRDSFTRPFLLASYCLSITSNASSLPQFEASDYAWYELKVY